MLLIPLLLLLILPGAQAAESSPVTYFSKAQNQVFTYEAAGQEASATLSVPQQPNGNLVLYLHPTTGIDDWCAPSRVSENSYFNDDGMRSQLRDLLDQGYTILQPDYQGLGTPGPHPFLRHRKNIPAIKAALQKTFQEVPGLSGKYAILGYSQGAALALEAAHRSAQMPGVLHGTVAIAPPSFIPTQIRASLLLEGPNPGAALLIYMMQSSGRYDLMTPLAKEIYREGRDMCVLEFTSLVIRKGLTMQSVIDTSDPQKVRDFLRGFPNPQGPIPGNALLISADDDRTVFPSLVHLLAKELREGGSQVEELRVQGDHFSITKNSWSEAEEFIEKSLEGPGSRFYLEAEE